MLTDLIRISAPDGAIAVKGIAKEIRIYGDYATVYAELTLNGHARNLDDMLLVAALLWLLVGQSG